MLSHDSLIQVQLYHLQQLWQEKGLRLKLTHGLGKDYIAKEESCYVV